MAKIVGLKSLRQQLNRVPDAILSPIKRELAALGDEMVDYAKVLVPKDEHDLERSIGWTFGTAPGGSIKLGELRPKNRSNFAITVFAGDSEAFYARWQEFGTVKFAAQPYFFPAYRAIKPKAARKLALGIQSSLRKSFR